MQKIQLKGHKVTLYDSIDEMPVARYHKFTQLMVLGDGTVAVSSSKVLRSWQPF